MFKKFLSHSLKRRYIHTGSCLNQSTNIFYNLSYSELFTHESSNKEGGIMKLNIQKYIRLILVNLQGDPPKINGSLKI